MAQVLLSMLSGLGAASHLLTVAERLRTHGHRVTVVTSPVAAPRYARAGFDVRTVPEPAMPRMLRTLPPLAARAQQLYVRVQRMMIDPLADQWAVVERVIADERIDVIVTDPLFLGAAMLAARPRGARPAVVMLGLSAPWIPDPGVPPYGMGISPATVGTDRVRVAVFELLASRAMKLLSRSFNRRVEEVFGVRLREDLRRSPRFADAWVQLSVPRFEYPRVALPANFTFVGPLHAPEPPPHPEWWDPVAEPPVVAVHADEGTALHDLVLPTVRAFARSASTVLIGGWSRSEVTAAFGVPLPDNVHFEPTLPWGRLRPGRTVVVSDGDYLHAQQALRHGIPLVIAGTLETHVATAARVEWSGTGVDLRTSRPSPDAIRAAVERIRADGRCVSAAARIAAQMAPTDAEGTIASLVGELAAGVPRPASV